MLSANDVSKHYGSLHVLSGLNLSVPDGCLISLVGPSGCGKSTILNLFAGLDRPDSGAIATEGCTKVGYLMQDALLLPWRTLGHNARLGIEVTRSVGSQDGEALVNYFRAFDLAIAMDVLPEAASGGMRQRVALIRTLLTEPSALLLDEPFSGLDFDIKLKIQKYLLEYQNQHGTTIILVTHDIEDAIALSHEVVVLSGKPSKVKTVIPIDIVSGRHDPIEARKSPRFAEYFARIWDEIKYLDEG